MRTRYRYDPDTKSMLPLGEWLAKHGDSSVKSHHLTPEFAPYRAVTGDKAGEMITSRREHREFLRRNNLQEVGNEYSYMTRHGGMTADNPNLVSDERYEDEICRDLVQTLDQLRR